MQSQDMKALFDCEVDFVNSPHLLQLYTGFFELEKKGLITLRFGSKNHDKNALAITRVLVNNKYTVVYDTTDGGSFQKMEEKNNLYRLKENSTCGFYFKRSYRTDMLAAAPAGFRVFPLGFNYNIQPDANMLPLINATRDKVKYLLKTSALTRRLVGKSFFYAKDFEQPPLALEDTKILFITRLWNPEEAKSEGSKILRQRINDTRVACIEACTKKYGAQFTSGLVKDTFSEKHFPHLLLPDELTNKKEYLNAIKQHSICIATTGLHHSIGWKMAEYVAASKAILSEPLHFELPGNFEKNKHYLAFTNVTELIERIDCLLHDKERMMQMMQDNHQYYNQYVKPDALVLNTLNTVVALAQENPLQQQAIHF